MITKGNAEVVLLIKYSISRRKDEYVITKAWILQTCTQEFSLKAVKLMMCIKPFN